MGIQAAFGSAFLLCILVQCNAQNSPEVDTPLGKVRGLYKDSYGGRRFAAFEGIPYAQPPIGNLRFKEPEMVQPWTDVVEAQEVQTCIQIDMSVDGFANRDVMGNEDCLYLNVYSSNEAPNATDNFDVIVFIHGGAFVTGSGSAGQPGVLMDRDFVLVSINYRLGVLGFLCSMDEFMSCNNGLKDQALALTWVQNNIKSFGGNPDSVTIAGQSAGGSSVHYHYLSSLSKGLFHRGFSLSGTALDPWAFQRKPLENTFRVANSVGCANSSAEVIVECLRDLPASSVVKGLFDLFDFLTFPIAPLAPSLEPEGEGAFLTDYPYELLVSRKFNDVPWLTSSTSDEGIMAVLAPRLHKNIDLLNTNWDDIIHYMVDTNTTAPDEDKQAIAEEIRYHYFGNASISSNNLDALAKMFSEREFLGGFQRASLIQANLGTSPVYDFVLAYIGQYSFTNSYQGETNLTGVVHADDVQYIFSSPSKFTESDDEIRKIYLNMVESFVKTDKPSVNDINWAPISDPAVLTYLLIEDAENISVRRTRDLAALEFWNSLPLKEYENS